ncbi:MAG: ATP-binding protein [Micromonosporaceae bacterium]
MTGAGAARDGGVEVLLHRRFDEASLRDTRHDVRRQLISAGLNEDRADDFTFAINEGLINAIMHGGGSGDLALARTGRRLIASVEDRRPTTPFALPTQLPPPPALGGRGLWLVSRSCDAVHLESGRHGLRLVMEIELPARVGAD